MKQEPKAWRQVVYAGSGLAIGAALGLLFSMMLLENLVAGPLVGAVGGALIGWIWELQTRRGSS